MTGEGMTGISNRARRSRGGFTLVELMISMAVIAIAILGVISVVMHTVRSKEKMRELDLAKQAAATRLEELRSVDFDTLSNTASPVYDKFTVAELAHPSGANQRAYGWIKAYHDGSANFNPDLVDLEVTIEWVGVMGSSKYQARSLYTR